MIRSLSRGLDILNFLNRFRSGTPVILARELKVPRATVHGILETLIEKGYVYQHPSDGEFPLTSKVRMLSSGFIDQAVMANLGRHLMEEVTKTLVWPVSFSAISGTDLVIYENTDASSPLAVEKFKIGYRMPILETASGICILAFMTASEREDVLVMLSKTADPQDQVARQAAWLTVSIEEVSRIGYATHRRKRERFDISAIAVPVRAGDKVYGALTLRYHEPAISQDELENVIFPVLNKAAMDFSALLTPHVAHPSFIH